MPFLQLRTDAALSGLTFGNRCRAIKVGAGSPGGWVEGFTIDLAQGRNQRSIRSFSRTEDTMSAVGLESIDHTVQLAHTWINDLDGQLQWNNKARSYRLLRAALHALRDWLQVNEAVDLAAQLPTLLRGVYYEQWRPATVPVKERSKAEFLKRIDTAFANDPLPDSEFAVRCFFRLLSHKVTGGEIEDVRHALPADLRALWSPAARAA
jgi:uncharacterized protein (DUF2267 family)